MADPTDERLREISQGATIYGHERNAIAAELLAARNKIRADEEHLPTIGRLTQDLHETEQELLAARARIAKLEQEPPMALVDFGVGVNWKGLHEDMQRLRAERDALRTQLHADDQRAWEALGKPEGTHETTNVQRLCAEVERLRDMLARLCIAVERATIGFGVYEEWYEIHDYDLLALRERMIEARALLAKHEETDQ